MKYKQCLMQGVKGQYVAWIPENVAVVGKTLSLKDDNDWIEVSDNVWKVQDVYSIAFDKEIVEERSRDYKKTRIASDI